MDERSQSSGTLLMLRVDCTHPGCTRCVAQITNGMLRFRAKHDGQTHSVELPLATLLRVLEASGCKAVEMPMEIMAPPERRIPH